MIKFRGSKKLFGALPEAGFERIQGLFFLAVVIVIAMLLGPTLVKKAHAEHDIRMKILLRSFHSANEAYRQRNPAEGYARDISVLTHNNNKLKYLGKEWLKPSVEGFSTVYQAQELSPRYRYSLLVHKSSFLKSTFCIDHKGILRSESTPKETDRLTADDAGCHGGIEVV